MNFHCNTTPRRADRQEKMGLSNADILAETVAPTAPLARRILRGEAH